MTKFIRLSFLTFFLSAFYFTSVQAQETPTDPPEEPPVLTKTELNEADSKMLFDILDKWNLVKTDRETKAKNILVTSLDCVENMEGGRQVGCSLFDELHSLDLTKYNKNADPLFKFLVERAPMECEEDSETCMLSAEKIDCSLTENKYLCDMEVLVPQPQKKKGDSK